MYHLVYTSHAAIPYAEEDLIALLKQSRQYNLAHHITGMLLYLNGKFIQVLEGKKEDVHVLYDKICRNPRHRSVLMVMEGTSRRRLFKDWSMGFKRLTDEEFESYTGYRDIDRFFHEHQHADKGNLLMTFLTMFYKKNMADYVSLPIF